MSLLKQLMKYPKDKIMQQNLALPVIARWEQEMEKLKIEKKIVKIEPLVKKGYHSYLQGVPLVFEFRRRMNQYLNGR